MSWNPTLTYRGDCRDTVGQIVGPNVHKEYFIIKSTDYFDGIHVQRDDGSSRVIGDATKVTLELMGPDKPPTREAVDLFRVARARKIAEENGRQDFINDHIPPALQGKPVRL